MSLLRCNFCGKNSEEVGALVAGPAVYICNECIGLCVQILGDNIVRKKKIIQTLGQLVRYDELGILDGDWGDG